MAEWLSIEQVARTMGVSDDTIRRQCYERQGPDDPVPPGRIPAVRVGHQWRIHHDYLAEKRALARHQANITTIRQTRRRLRRNETTNLLGL